MLSVLILRQLDGNKSQFYKNILVRLCNKYTLLGIS